MHQRPLLSSSGSLLAGIAQPGFAAMAECRIFQNPFTALGTERRLILPWRAADTFMGIGVIHGVRRPSSAAMALAEGLLRLFVPDPDGGVIGQQRRCINQRAGYIAEELISDATGTDDPLIPLPAAAIRQGDSRRGGQRRCSCRYCCPGVGGKPKRRAVFRSAGQNTRGTMRVF